MMKLSLFIAVVAAFVPEQAFADHPYGLFDGTNGWCLDAQQNPGGQPTYERFDHIKDSTFSGTAGDCADFCAEYPGTFSGVLNGGLLGFTWGNTMGICECHYTDGAAPGDRSGCAALKAADSRISQCMYSAEGVAIDTTQVNPGNEDFWCYAFNGNVVADGDPHFRTWKNEHFEFHGQCDLVMTKVKDFIAEGIDLEIQIRTKIVRYWSFIQSAVIRIGDDILEIEGSAKDFDSAARYWYNYDYKGEMETFAGFPVQMFSQVGTAITKNRIEIDLSSKFPGQKIILKTFKEFVGVKIQGATQESFGNAEGITGNFNTGKTLARDGVTELNDFNELGLEWQVLPSDGKLFRTTSKPQFPELCYLPEDPQGDRARRLDESSISEEAAEAACSQLEDEFDRKSCIYDILATQDMDMVGVY